MSLSCVCGDYDDEGWWFWPPNDYTLASVGRRNRCCSCKQLIERGSICTMFTRGRGPQSELEERINGDEIPLASWWMCERCSDLYFSLTELGFCITLGDSMLDLAREYRDDYVPSRRHEARP